jgi:hypothetical protein
MKKAWIFGAGTGGANSGSYVVNMGYKIQGYVDNKVISDQLTEFQNLPLISPSSLSEREFDKIFIATQYINEVLHQLLGLGISEDKVKIVPLNVRIQGEDAAKIVVQDCGFEFIKSREREVYKTLWLSSESAATKGDIAEFGVGAGRSTYYIAKAMVEVAKSTQLPLMNLHLFDTFEGFPKAHCDVDIGTPTVVSGAWRAGSAFGLDVEDMEYCLRQQTGHNKVVSYKGLFSDTLNNIPQSQRFAMVHIDCDLYESTFQVLDHLITNNMLLPGCLILFDNWASNSHSNNYSERKAWIDINIKHNLDTEHFGLYGAGCCKKIFYGRKN